MAKRAVMDNKCMSDFHPESCQYAYAKKSLAKSQHEFWRASMHYAKQALNYHKLYGQDELNQEHYLPKIDTFVDLNIHGTIALIKACDWVEKGEFSVHDARYYMLYNYLTRLNLRWKQYYHSQVEMGNPIKYQEYFFDSTSLFYFVKLLETHQAQVLAEHFESSPPTKRQYRVCATQLYKDRG